MTEQISPHLRAVHRIISRAQLASLAGKKEIALNEARSAHALLGMAIAAAENHDLGEAISLKLIRDERAQLLERLVSDTEPLLSPERDTRHEIEEPEPT